MTDANVRTGAASGPKSALDALLGEQGHLAPVIRRARWLETLGRHLYARLPFPLNQHARLANIESEQLIYLVDSPVWHARLRLSGESLLDAARSIGLKVTSLRIRIARQPFDLHARAMGAVDVRMQREYGVTSTERQALAEICALLAED